MKSAFITGAASGIGLATARRLASDGWFVGLYDINREAVDELLSSGEFPAACGGSCDVTRHDSVQAAIAHFAGASGGREAAGGVFAGASSAPSTSMYPTPVPSRISTPAPTTPRPTAQPTSRPTAAPTSRRRLAATP